MMLMLSDPMFTAKLVACFLKPTNHLINKCYVPSLLINKRNSSPPPHSSKERKQPDAVTLTHWC